MYHRLHHPQRNLIMDSPSQISSNKSQTVTKFFWCHQVKLILLPAWKFCHHFLLTLLSIWRTQKDFKHCIQWKRKETVVYQSTFSRTNNFLAHMASKDLDYFYDIVLLDIPSVLCSTLVSNNMNMNGIGTWMGFKIQNAMSKC